MTTVDRGLDTPVTPGDMESLMAVMCHIRDVRKKMEYMTKTFVPLREMVMLLKTHGIALDLGVIGNDHALDFLENAPLVWDNTVNKTFRVKEEIQPLQNAMVDTIKSDISAFTVKVTSFVKKFRDSGGPFNWPVTCAVFTHVCPADGAALTTLDRRW